jgi:putative FmdB family regulatory protein
MPIYEYSCSNCGTTLDVLQKMNDPAPVKCEKCGAENTLSRIVSRTSFVLKGGGWYSDLYGSSKKDGGGSASSSSAPAAPSSGESSASPAPASSGAASTSATPAPAPAAPAVKK